MLDWIQKCFSYGHYGQHATRIGLDRIHAWIDFPHLIWFSQTIAQNWPESDLHGLDRFWPKGSGPEASQCATVFRPTSGRSQPTRYQFPTFRLVVFLCRWHIILCKKCKFLGVCTDSLHCLMKPHVLFNLFVCFELLLFQNTTFV